MTKAMKPVEAEALEGADVQVKTAREDCAAVFSRWLEAIVVVKFDVRDGQVVEYVYPPEKQNSLTKEDKKKICHLALPDANSGHDGDVQFSFRIRQGTVPIHSMSPLKQPFLFATAFYRQTRDPSQPRGYFQKSVVVVSRHPYASFLEDCARIIGPLYFEFGKTILKATSADIHSWEPPIPGVAYELPLGGTTLYFRVPWTGLADDEVLKKKAISLKKDSKGDYENSKHSLLLDTKESIIHEIIVSDADEDSDLDGYGSPDSKVVKANYDDKGNITSPKHPKKSISPPSITLGQAFEAKTQENPGLFQGMPLFSTFGGLSVALWHIWELAIVGEPIIVLAPTPDRCSRAVLSIASLIAPLIYSGDYRPYFTIYDPDFSEISKLHNTMRGQHMPPTVLGVTNPYFLKALEYWPNVISVGYLGHKKREQNIRESVDYKDNDNDESEQNHPGKVRRLSIDGVNRRNSIFKNQNGTTAEYHPTVAKRSDSLKNLLSDQQYENSIILTRDEPLIPPNESVLKQLMVHKATEETKAAAAAAVCAGESWEAPAVAINNAVLRQHFRQLTAEFLRPLERYFKLEAVGSRAAKKRGIKFSAYSQHRSFAMNMHQFNVDAFMQQLETETPPKILQHGDWRQLYRNFIRGPNFWPWFSMKRMELNEKLTYIHRHLKLNTDPAFLVKTATGTTLQSKEEELKRKMSEDNVERMLLENQNDDSSFRTLERYQTRSAPPEATAVGLSCFASSSSSVIKNSRSIVLDELPTPELLLERIHRSLNDEYSKPAEDRDNELCEKMLQHMNALNAILHSDNNSQIRT